MLLRRQFPTVAAHPRLVLAGFLIAAVVALLVPRLMTTVETEVSLVHLRPTVSQLPQRGDEIVISKLGLTVPIIREVSDSDEAAYLAALEHGVASLAGSATPDQPGNGFIFGHSSYFRDRPGDYKEVFKTLDQLVTGDRITVRFDSATYEYEAVETKIVTDTDWSIAAPSVDGAERTLTLMTCWPPGSLAKRLAVIAKQVNTPRQE